MGVYGGWPSERPYDPIGGMAKRNADQAVKKWEICHTRRNIFF